jgi:hypothetical protein
MKTVTQLYAEFEKALAVIAATPSTKQPQFEAAARAFPGRTADMRHRHRGSAGVV